MDSVFFNAFFDELEKTGALALKGTRRRARQVKSLAQGIKAQRKGAPVTPSQAKSKAFGRGMQLEQKGKVYTPGMAGHWQRFSRPIAQAWQQGGAGNIAKGLWAGAKASPMMGAAAGLAGLALARPLVNSVSGQRQSPGAVPGYVNIPG